MRRLRACLLIACVCGVLGGCGGAGGIQPGVPSDTGDAPKYIDPAGGTQPDMKGGKAPRI